MEKSGGTVFAGARTTDGSSHGIDDRWSISIYLFVLLPEFFFVENLRYYNQHFWLYSDFVVGFVPWSRLWFKPFFFVWRSNLFLFILPLAWQNFLSSFASLFFAKKNHGPSPIKTKKYWTGGWKIKISQWQFEMASVNRLVETECNPLDPSFIFLCTPQ